MNKLLNDIVAKLHTEGLISGYSVYSPTSLCDDNGDVYCRVTLKTHNIGYRKFAMFNVHGERVFLKQYNEQTNTYTNQSCVYLIEDVVDEVRNFINAA